MKITIPPAIQGPAYAVLSWIAAERFPDFSFNWGGFRFIAAGFAAAGLTIIAIAISQFIKAKTTINPVNPDAAEKLVIKGLYRVSRNPMYLGVLLLLLAWAAYLQNVLSFVPPLVFVLTMTLFQIKPEEKALCKKFGADYDAYCRRVRRWI